MFDVHIHLYTTEWKKDVPARFLEKTHSLGVIGGAVFSPPPESFDQGNEPWEKRLDSILRFTEKTPGFLPVYWFDPLDKDAAKQLDAAKAAGVYGYKIICNHFYPKEALPALQHIASLDLPVIFHSGVLYSRCVASDYNRPMNFEILRTVSGLRFAMAHLAWPWTAEYTSLFGELASSSARENVQMYADLTPGTPLVFRKEALRHFLLPGYTDVENRILWGSDNSAEDYCGDVSAKDIESDRRMLEEIAAEAAGFDIEPERFKDLFGAVSERNFKEFFNLKK